MSRLTARVISLSLRQQKLLEQEKNRCKIALDKKRRIDIILLSASGMSNHKISERLGTSYSTVLKWRNRWHGSQEALSVFEQGIETACSDSSLLKQMLDILGDAARVGRPARLSLAQYKSIQTLACCKPADYGLPFEQWTGELLAKTAIEQGIVDRISGRYVNVLLKKK